MFLDLMFSYTKRVTETHINLTMWETNQELFVSKHICFEDVDTISYSKDDDEGKCPNEKC